MKEKPALGALAASFGKGLAPLETDTLLSPMDMRPATTGQFPGRQTPLPPLKEQRPFTASHTLPSPNHSNHPEAVKLRHVAQDLKGSCKGLLRDHLRKRYGLKKTAPERIKLKDKQGLPVEALRRILYSVHPTVQHCVHDARMYLSQIHSVSADAAEILSWARACLEICVVFMELQEPQQAYVMAEYGLQIMDPMLRDLVDPSVRDEDISPAYRCALAETACLCFCNAALCIEAEQGKKGAPQITKYLDKGLQLAETLLNEDHPLIALLDDCFDDASKKYGRKRLVADMALFTFEREETERKRELMEKLSFGAPFNFLSLPDLVTVTNRLEKHPGSTFTGGVKPIRDIIEKPLPSPRKKSSQERNKSSDVNPKKPQNPFKSYDNKELIQQEKRKWLYPNPEYVAHRVVEFKFKKKIMKQFQEMKTNDEMYQTKLFHMSFSAVFTDMKMKKAKEAASLRDAQQVEKVHTALNVTLAKEALIAHVHKALNATRAKEAHHEILRAKSLEDCEAIAARHGISLPTTWDETLAKEAKRRRAASTEAVAMGEVGKFLQKSTDYAATTGFHGRCSKKQSREYYEEDVLPEAERQREIDREWEAKLAKHRALEEQLEHEHAEAEASSKAKKAGGGAAGDDAENAEGADQE
jgi:hypothetical protein